MSRRERGNDESRRTVQRQSSDEQRTWQTTAPHRSLLAARLDRRYDVGTRNVATVALRGRENGDRAGTW